ncbi:MAG: 1-acyl-sn-glycerol-3-phosphate acyltransferase [Chlamydiales bacterium]|nr:1-acyl-sn-glycerol-3-phosphate acyltransferase [Chlamydiales bacterium]
MNGKFEKLLEKIEDLVSSKVIPEKYPQIFREFLNSYQEVIIEHGEDPENYIGIFDTFIELVKEGFKKPFTFEPYHEKIRAPFDYYKFGIDFLRPLVDLPNSTVSGAINLEYMESFLKKKENVILFANHQIEADPQAISILLEKMYPKFAEELIFVAGTRVTSDPLAIPFSMGRNLLCIHSKKYIDNPPEQKHEKQMHNKRTMERMVELLAEGGHAIYVAPSGGRDRTNAQGIIEVAPFDPQSIEMFYLMAQKGKTPTHFYPLALSTYHLLPPPETTEIELGETRVTRGGAIHLHFGEEVDMENFPGAEGTMDKKDKRRIRAEYLWNCVKKNTKSSPNSFMKSEKPVIYS